MEAEIGARMNNRRTILAAGAVALGLAVFAAGCGDDSTSGPMFGDLAFTPSFENIGTARSAELSLRNSGSTDLGPVLLGVDVIKRTTMPDSICSTIGTGVSPGSISSLAPGEEDVVEVSFDTQNVDLVDCPAGQYDADVFAAVNGTILGGATLRFDWDGTPP